MNSIGVDEARLFIHNITAPVVSCNLDLLNEPLLANEPNLMKSKVLTMNGRKIGIIGYLTPETSDIANVGNMKLLPEIPSITSEVKRLKNEGIDILIALGHSGFEMDIEIARHVEDIDLVIGGHSNTFLYTGRAPDIEKPIGTYPYLVEQPKTKRKVPVVQAFHITKYLGQLWLEFDSAGEVTKSYGNPILLDSHIEQDPKLSSEVKILEKEINDQTKQVIGSSGVTLEGDNEHCRARECNLGNFITDSYVDYNLRIYMKSFDLKKHWTDAPISILQSGGVRRNIDHTTRGGNITLYDLVSALPFQNDIGKITVNGSAIWSALEFGVRRYSTNQLYGEFLQVSGLKVVIDLGRPSGNRVKSVLARCGNCAVPVYEQLDLNANYTVIVNDYLAKGGDGHVFLKSVDFHSLRVSELDVIRKELRVKSPIRPEVGDRIVLLNADKLEMASGQLVSTPLSLVVLVWAVITSMSIGL